MLDRVTRYGRLYAHFLQFSFSRAMEFRLDFYFRIFMDVGYYAVNIAFFRLIYLHTPMLGGWNEKQAMLFVSIYLVVDAVHMTVFTNNLWGLAQSVNKGGLDYYLVRPVSTLFFVSLREFAASSFVNLIMALGIMGWALSLNPEVLSLGNCLFLGLLVANGVLLHYLIHMLYIVPVFWTHSANAMSDAYHIFSRFQERPDRIFRGGMRIFTTVVLPLSLVASFPARLFLEPMDWGLFAQLVVVTIGFASFILFLWRRGLRAYASASS